MIKHYKYKQKINKTIKKLEKITNENKERRMKYLKRKDIKKKKIFKKNKK